MPRRPALLWTLLLVCSSALACSVPVFRYGLEHWAPDPYQIFVFHEAPLSAPKQTLLKQLSNTKHANLKVQVINPASAPQELRQLWERSSKPEVMVLGPPNFPTKGSLWTGALSEADINTLLDSPVRQDIAQRLGSGDSAVWVLLESADKAANDAAAKTLEQALQQAGETLELPKLDDQDIKNGLVSVPDDGLRLTFPMIRLARDNPREAFLIRSLLSTEPDLKDVTGPIAFPIFGRGRVLYSLVGRGIKFDNVSEAARFLIGSCSCQIKEQNPGADLLIRVDWQKLLGTSTTLEELPTVDEIMKRKPILVPIPERKAKK